MADFAVQLQEYANLFDSWAQHTVVFKSAALDGVADMLGGATGFEADKIKYLLALFGAFPLSAVFAMLPRGQVRHAFSLIAGVAVAQFVLKSGWIHAFVSSFIVYVLLALANVLPGLRRYRHFVVFLFMMGYMSASHVYRMYVDYLGWTLDFTGPQMLLTIKLTSLAFNYHDGTVGAGAIDKVLKAETPKPALVAVMSSRRQLAISKLPNLLEYFGFVFCYTSFLAGPAFEITEYLGACSGENYVRKGSKDTAATAVPPPRAMEVVKLSIQALVCLAGMAVGGGMMPITQVYDAAWIANNSFLHRAGYAWLSLLFVRCKYYFGWLLSEAAAVQAGFGFEGYDDKGASKGWRGARNIDVLGFELAENLRAGTRAWNQCTQAWLERYVYNRTGGSLMATYFVSAFWHGFYPGYYLFFMSVPIATETARLSFKRVRPMFLTKEGKPASNKWLYDVFTVICTSLSMNYLAMVFQVLAFEYAITTWTSFYFAGHVAWIGAGLVLKFFFKEPRSAPKKTDAAAAAPAAAAAATAAPVSGKKTN